MWGDLEVLGAYEKSRLRSVATKNELAKLKAAARATAIAEEWHRRLAGQMTSDSAELIREDRDR